MKLIKTFEKFRNHQLQVIELTCEINFKVDIEDLGYDDFKANLFIDRKYIGDISHVLSDAGVFSDMVDSVDWFALYSAQSYKKAS